MDLIIVESPHKAKTISHYLKSKYRVIASYGHIIDLPAKKLGIDVDNLFTPEWTVMAGKAKTVEYIKDSLKNIKKVYLASDPDREGEAIAYHIQKIIEETHKNIPIQRLCFYEITAGEIEKALKQPREVDLVKVESQITRRLIDRLMGFYLSPFLWKTLKNYKLSAGRVQSVVLRFIYEKELEIEAFLSKTYFEMKAVFKKNEISFDAVLIQAEDKKSPFEDKVFLENLKKKLGKTFRVSNIEKKETRVYPKPPFTTSELQKDAANHYGFNSSKTMQVAQKLYEGIHLEKGLTGLITYMRTDSVRVSEQALEQLRGFIRKNMGELLSPSPRLYSNQKNAKVQDAHEAIRPVNIFITPKSIETRLSPDEYKLYSLIWRRFTASQMKEAVYEDLKISLENQGSLWECKGKKRLFEGFEKFYPTYHKETILPEIKLNEELNAESVKINKKETKPPSRYTEASLIDKMEKTGIGRPSTYAPTLKLLLARNYIEKVKNTLKPTQIGRVVSQVLVNHFNTLVSVDFTATMEDELDKIETHDSSRLFVLKNFFKELKKALEEAGESLSSENKTEYLEKSKVYHDKPCPVCGKRMVQKKGKYGFFFSCEDYPKCKHLEKKEEVKVYREEVCPDCGKKVIRKKSKWGFFWGCEGYPVCKFTQSIPRKSSSKAKKKKD